MNSKTAKYVFFISFGMGLFMLAMAYLINREAQELKIIHANINNIDIPVGICPYVEKQQQ